MSYINNFYKIRDRETGLFRGKGMWAKWDKKGAEWSSLGHLKQHLSQFPADKIAWKQWEVVEYSYTPVETGRKLLIELL